MSTSERPQISPHHASRSKLIESLLELAMPEHNLPHDHETIDNTDILKTCSERISKLIPLEGHAFFLVDDAMDFQLTHFSPVTQEQTYQVLVERWIEDGIFSWALNQNRAVLLNEEKQAQYILHVIATHAKVFGMYIAAVSPDTELDEGSLALLSVILMNCATSLETHELHQELKRYTVSLETQVAERTRQLELAKDRAEEAARQKSAFMATMSHEIRTPMNGVIGMAQMLMKTSLDEAQQEYTRIITQSGESLVLLINDILDFSKIEAGKLRLAPHPTDLVQLCLDVVTLLKPMADEKQLKIGFTNTSHAQLWVHIDSSRMRQILINLLGNAVKFTTQGSVRIHLDAINTQHDYVAVHLAVIDTGIGIPSEKQEQLFKPFKQLHHHHPEAQNGTGLGLAICKQLVEMMGGDINISSESGQGSTFSIRVDLKISDANDETVCQAATCQQLENMDFTQFKGKILVAEDNIVNQKVIQLILQSMGLRCKIVEHGEAAVEALQHSKFDLVFMDCRMPVMDGYEASRKIRASEGLNQRIPIISLSANALDEDRQRCAEAGMDDFIPKPIDQGKLAATLQKWLNIDIGERHPPATDNASPASSDGLIDQQRLNYLKTLSPEQFKPLVESFLEHTDERVKKLRQAIENNDSGTAHSIAHAIKGSSATFGAQHLYELAVEMDSLARAGELAPLQARLPVFEDCFRHSSREILALLQD